MTRRAPSERYGRLKQAGEGLINNSMQYPAHNYSNSSQQDRWRTDNSRLNSSFEFMAQVHKYNKLKNKLLVTKLQQQRNKRKYEVNRHRNIKNVLHLASARKNELKPEPEEVKSQAPSKDKEVDRFLGKTNHMAGPQNAVPFIPTTQNYPYSFSQPMPDVNTNMAQPQDFMNNDRMIEELMKKINEQRHKKSQDSLLMNKISSLEEENRNLERRSQKVQKEMKALDQQRNAQPQNPFGGYNPALMGQSPFGMSPYPPGYPMGMPKRKKRRPSPSSSSSDSTNSLEEKEEYMLKKKYYLRRLDAKLKTRIEDKEIEERMKAEEQKKREEMDRIEEMKRKKEEEEEKKGLGNIFKAMLYKPLEQDDKPAESAEPIKPAEPAEPPKPAEPVEQPKPDEPEMKKL